MMKNKVLSRGFLLIGTIFVILWCFVRNEAQCVDDTESSPPVQYYPQVNWADYDTLAEKVAAIQIPEEQLLNMTTEELLEALIVYPLWRWDIMPSSEDPYAQMYSECNVLREFVSRPEADEELTKKLEKIERLYEASEISKSEYVWGKYYLETILANLEERQPERTASEQRIYNIQNLSFELPEGVTIGEYDPIIEAGGYLLLPYAYFNESDSAPEYWKTTGAISCFLAKDAVEWNNDNIVGVDLHANHTSYEEIGPIDNMFWPAYLLKGEHDIITIPELMEYEVSGGTDTIDAISEYWYVVFAKPEEDFGFLVSLATREYTKEEMIDFVSSFEYALLGTNKHHLSIK